MRCIDFLHQELVRYHNNDLYNDLNWVNPSVQTVVQVPVELSAATAAPHSSAGTPGWGVIRNAAKISVSVTW